MEKEKEFIKQILDIRNYWLNVHPENAKEAVDGFIHSLLVMFDGDAGRNDFHPIELKDLETGTIINDIYPLHEIFHMINNKEGK